MTSPDVQMIEDSSRSPGARLIRMMPVAIVLTALVTWFYLHPAITHCSTIMLGKGAPDAESGGIWTAWQFKELSAGPWSAHTPFVSAPTGEPLSQPSWITAMGTLIPLSLMAQVTTPVCAWNVVLFLGFVATAIGTFGAAYWITRNGWAASIASFAFTFSPYRIQKAEAHYGNILTQFFPLVVLACCLIWTRPKRRHALLLGVSVAALAYTDAYYVVMVPVLVGAFSLGAIAVLLRRRAYRDLLKRARMLALGMLIAGLLLTPVMLTYLSVRVEASRIVRPKVDVYSFTARPWDYVFPSNNHPLVRGPRFEIFGWEISRPLYKQLFQWPSDRLHGSNFTEQTLYLGLVPSALAIYALFALRRKKEEASLLKSFTGEPRIVLAGLMTATMVCILFSFPPTFELGNLTLPLPSGVLYSVFSFLRTFARFFIPAHIAWVMLAAIGASLIFRDRSIRWKAGVAGLLLLLNAFEFLVFPPRQHRRFADKPELYSWLAQQDDIDTVVEYPSGYLYDTMPSDYLAAQPIHGKKLVNSVSIGSIQREARLGTTGLNDPQTLPTLRRWGTDLVLIHHGSYVPRPSQPLPQELELVRSFGRPEAPDSVYRIRPGPRAKYVLGPVSGFSHPENKDFESARWIERSRATMRIQSLTSESGPVRVSFHARSPFFSRELVVTQDGKKLWSGQVTESTLVEFDAAAGLLRLSVSPGPRVISKMDPTSTDKRNVAIAIWRLSAQAI